MDALVWLRVRGSSRHCRLGGMSIVVVGISPPLLGLLLLGFDFFFDFLVSDEKDTFAALLVLLGVVLLAASA